MSDTNPAVDPPEDERPVASPARRTEDLGGDDVASAPAAQPRDGEGGIAT
ncbi:MAG TPA: hypothetical protein VFH64_01130 [Amnibacterium sp.]|jgi:hypothetical protein|nr:hypothetical protein [Amnibacterium sp.]